MLGTKRGKGVGGDAPESFSDFFWRLLDDPDRLANLIKLGKTAVGLICVLLICLGGVVCSVLVALVEAGAKGPGLPVLLPSGLVCSVSVSGFVIVLRKLLSDRRRGALGDGSDPTPSSLPPSREQVPRAPKRRR
jgi:hypothetical protein